jgi:hypothetical protein
MTSLQDSSERSVGTSADYGLEDRVVGIRVQVMSKMFPSPRRPDRLRGPPSLQYSGYRKALSSVVKRPGRETDHSPSTSAEAKKTSTFPPPYV